MILYPHSCLCNLLHLFGIIFKRAYAEMIERRFREETPIEYIDLLFLHSPQHISMTLNDLFERLLHLDTHTFTYCLFILTIFFNFAEGHCMQLLSLQSTKNINLAHFICFIIRQVKLQLKLFTLLT